MDHHIPKDWVEIADQEFWLLMDGENYKLDRYCNGNCFVTHRGVVAFQSRDESRHWIDPQVFKLTII